MLHLNSTTSLIGYPANMLLDPRVVLDGQVDVSIVIPLLNEADNVEQLYERLHEAMEMVEESCEVIFIDDGSSDGTFQALQALHARDPRLWVIRFRRNFGQTAAFSAGFHLARGKVVVTLDGDLQNDPRDMGLLLEKIAEGYDVVSGWRVDRKDTFLTRKLPSKLANALISQVTGVKLHDYGCSLKAYRAEVAKNVQLYGEMHRFIPALASSLGIRVAEVPVRHYARQFGRSKYGLGRTMRVLLDLFTVKFLLDYATRPLQIFGFLGMVSGGIGFLIALYLAYLRLFAGQSLSDRPILLLAILLIMMGVQLVTMGLLGEVLIRTYHETQGKPIYAIREILEAETPGAGREAGRDAGR